MWVSATWLTEKVRGLLIHQKELVMYRATLTTVILIVMSSTASAQIFCPFSEVIDLGDGWSEYWGEFCTGSFGNEILPSGLTVPQDCANQSGCFDTSESRQKFSLANKLYTGEPKVKMGRLLVDQSVRVRKDDEVRYFRFIAVLYKDIRMVAVAREIPKPEGRVIDLEHRLITKTDKGQLIANLGGITYQVRAVSDEGPSVKVAQAQD